MQTCDRCGKSFKPRKYGPHRRWCSKKGGKDRSVIVVPKLKNPTDTTFSTAQRLEAIEKEFRNRSMELAALANDLLEKAGRIQAVREAISRS